MKKQLRKSEIRELNEQVNHFNYEINKKDKVEIEITENEKLIIINNKVLFFYYNDKLVPTLKNILENPIKIKRITVDMGAVKFITNGADIMRPGITEIEQNIEKEGFIAIIDETHKKPLAIGIALKNSEDMQNTTEGKVIKNIHYIGDDIWNN